MAEFDPSTLKPGDRVSTGGAEVYRFVGWLPSGQDTAIVESKDADLVRVHRTLLRSPPPRDEWWVVTQSSGGWKEVVEAHPTAEAARKWVRNFRGAFPKSPRILDVYKVIEEPTE